MGAHRTEALLAKFHPQARSLAFVDGAPIGLPWSISAFPPHTGQNAAASGSPVTLEQFRPFLCQLQETRRPQLLYEAGEWLPQALIRNAGGALVPVDNKPATNTPAPVIPSRGDSLWRALSIPQMMAGFSGHGRQPDADGSFLAVYSKVKEQQEGAYKFMVEFVASRDGFAIWLRTGVLNVTLHDLPLRPGNEAAQAQFDSGTPDPTNWNLGALTAHIQTLQNLIAA